MQNCDKRLIGSSAQQSFNPYNQMICVIHVGSISQSFIRFFCNGNKYCPRDAVFWQHGARSAVSGLILSALAAEDRAVRNLEFYQ